MKLFYSVSRLLVCLTATFLIVTINSYAQTSLSFSAIPVSDPDLVAPGRGAEQWHDRTDVNVPIQGTNTTPMDVYYRFVATRISTNTKGVYNFSYLDNLFNDAINNRQKISFGIMTCYPDGGTDAGLVAFDGGTACYPQWLHTEMQAESVKDWRTGSTWTPNYNSQRYLTWLLELNQAINAHIEATSYNGVRYKDIVNCVDIRGYGAWGEWHSGYTPNNQVSDYPSGTFPTVATLKAIVDAHVNGFPNFQLVNMIAAFDANYLGNTRNPPEIAYYILTHKGNNKGPIGWRRDQWGALDSYLKAYLEDNTRSFNGVVFNTLIMERWKTAPITGEPPAWIPDDYSDLERQIRLYHATSFGNGNYGTNSPNTTIQNRVRASSKAAGYRLVLEGGSMATSITTGTPFALTLNWKNIGLSPTYENWDIVFELKNSGGTTVWSGKSAFQLRLFLPQSAATARTDNFTVPTSVAAGTYSLIMYVRDPNNYRQPLPLAITGRRSDGGYVIRSSVSVSPGSGTTNNPPVANAGTDKTITLPTNSTSLTGTGTDADGSVVGYLWQQVSGPSTSTLSATNTATINVSNLQQGTYTYRLTVTDEDGASDTDDVVVTVAAGTVNQAPAANAGTDRTITLPTNSASLNGTGSTDADGTIASYQWQQVSGPSTSALSATNIASITVNNLQAGTYTYRLTVTDNDGATATDNVTVNVNAAPPNQAPVANAGTNRTITLPTSSSNLAGSGTDADGTIATYRWQQVTGPSASILSATNTANITVSNLLAGVYTYRLTVTDNDGATATDDVTVTVNSALNQAPIANAGVNRTITLPTNSVNITGTGTDGDGTIASYLWQQVNGPSTATLSATNTAATTVSNLQAGVYTFRLTVTDNDGATDNDVMTVTVNAAPNQPPVANAGANKTITLPTSSANLTGSGTDADGTIAGYLWTQVSGPSTSTLSATNTAATTVSNLKVGIYTFRLRVTDNDGAVDTDDIIVTVNNAAANQSPNAAAGANRSITLPTNSTSLSGAASSDADGSIATYQWQQISGPSASTLSATNAAPITVSNLQAGVYTYRLTVTDNDGATATDDVTVTVVAAANQAPTANAGANRAITLPTNSTSLSGTASSDPDGTIATYLWQQISGPSASGLSATNTAGITVSNLQAGTYIYRLTVTDNDGATATDDVTVTVISLPNQAPIANAGTNLVISLPASSANLSGSGIDADGTISGYQWQQISGPTASTLSATNTANISVSNLQVGTYIYRLTVRDNDNATGTDNVTVTVNNAPPNQAPIADAGANRVITLPTNATSLSGAASSDVDGTIVSFLWQQVTGPSASTLSSTNTESINVSNLQAGVYTYRLTVRDNDNATSTATVTVTINVSPNTPPIAEAGADQTIVITANTTTLSAERSIDPDGTITSYRWQQVRGPGTTTFSALSGKTVNISNLALGEYVYRLTVTDNRNITATDTVKITVIDNFRNYTSPVAVYPNPATGIINLRLLNDNAGKWFVNVYDMNGKKVLPTLNVDKPAGSYSVQIDVSALKPGTYVIQASTFGYKKLGATFIKM